MLLKEGGDSRREYPRMLAALTSEDVGDPKHSDTLHTLHTPRNDVSLMFGLSIRLLINRLSHPTPS
jgi:hypothetical protein